MRMHLCPDFNFLLLIGISQRENCFKFIVINNSHPNVVCMQQPTGETYDRISVNAVQVKAVQVSNGPWSKWSGRLIIINDDNK